MMKRLPSGAFPGSNQRLMVGLKLLGKAFAQHAIESVVPSGFRPTRSQYERKILLLEGGSQKIFSCKCWAKIFDRTILRNKYQELLIKYLAI